MFFSLLTLSLAGYGYFSGEVWAIVGGIVVGIIAIRRTVLSFNKVGTVISFSALVVAITVGVLASLAYNDTNSKPEVAKKGTIKPEVAKIDTPKISNEQPPVAKKAPLKTPANNDEILKGLQITKSELERMACANQTHFDKIALSGKTNKNITTGKLLKLCGDSISIKFLEVPYERIVWNVWVKNNKDFTQVYNDEFVLITAILAPDETNNGVVQIEAQRDAMRKKQIRFIIIDINVDMKSRL